MMANPLRVMIGESGAQLATLPDQSVHCIVTSPPYWGQRDYKHADQLGNEGQWHVYVKRLVRIFDQAKRVLRDDGTLWLNIDDTFLKKSSDGMRAKNLAGIPWRVVFAMQDAGWFLRVDGIWNKPNPSPESAPDRPSRNHEYVFLFSKKPRYFFDQEPIMEESQSGPSDLKKMVEKKDRISAKHLTQNPGDIAKANPASNIGRKRGVGDPTARRCRSVWTIHTQPYRGAHFATFPEELAKRCILAGTSAHGACAQCGAPWTRIVEKSEPDLAHQRACGGNSKGEYHGKATKNFEGAKAQDASALKSRILAGMRKRRTIGWKAGCGCGADVVPCVVLDPFAGSGTTGLVALKNARRAILIELNPEYEPMIQERCTVTAEMSLAL